MEQIVLGLANLGVGGVLLILLIQGYLIPKSTVEREIKRADVATENAMKNAEALRSVTDALQKAFTQVSALVTEVTNLKVEIANLRAEILALRGLPRL